MKKIKYYYNTTTLRYEKLETPLRVKLLRIFGFIAAAFVTAALISFIAFRFVGSPNEKLLRMDNERLQDKYKELNERLKASQQEMDELVKRDNEVYRAIFEASPIPDSARAKALAQEQEISKVENMRDKDLVNSLVSSLNNLTHYVAAQKNSYDELKVLLKDKEKLLACTPAIQPVSNKDLNRIASGFGYRIDPIYKSVKFHPGLDFTAPQGTPIYATVNGVVTLAGNTADGYGNHV